MLTVLSKFVIFQRYVQLSFYDNLMIFITDIGTTRGFLAFKLNVLDLYYRLIIYKLLISIV